MVGRLIVPVWIWPFISQMTAAPVLRLRQSRSARPSALKSPVPASEYPVLMDGAVGALSKPLERTFQTVFAPDDVSRHKMSERLLPSRSPRLAAPPVPQLPPG